MLKHKISAIGLLLVCAMGLDAPAAASDKETRQMMADIRMLQEQQQQLQNLIASLGKAMSDALDAAVKTINAGTGRIDAKFDEQASSTNKAFANQKLTIDAITRDVGFLREKVDDSNVRVGSLAQEMTALRQLVTQLGAFRAAIDPDFGTPDSVTIPGAPASAAASAGESPQKLLDLARLDFANGQYSLAIAGFNAYLRTVPKSDFADDAQVYICSSFLNDKQYDKAVEACDLAIRNYPGGNAIPQAYYKKGLALRDLNRKDEAKEAFDYVVKNFPNSGEASLAATQLPQVTKP